MNGTKILVMVVMTSLFLTALAIPSEVSGEDISRELKNTHINLKAEDKVSPETEHKLETEGQSKHIMADYDDYNAVKTSKRWVDVGTWTSDGLSGDMRMQGTAAFNLWVRQTDAGDNDADFRFELKYNSDRAAYIEITGMSTTEGQAVEITASASISENIEAVSGETFTIYIQYRGWNDIDVLYDNMTYDSGMKADMDSVFIYEPSKDSTKFYDAWDTSWQNNGRHFCSITVNGKTYMGDDNTEILEGGEVEGGNGTTYEMFQINFNGIKINSGDSVKITITYAPNETAEGWQVSLTAGGSGDVGGGSSDDDDDDDFPIEMAGAGGVVIILLGVGGYIYMQKKNAAEDFYDEEDEEYYEDEEETEEE